VHRQLFKAFAAWQYRLSVRLKLILLIKHWRYRSLHFAVLLWKRRVEEYLSGMAALLDRVTATMARWRLRRLRNVFISWFTVLSMKWQRAAWVEKQHRNTCCTMRVFLKWRTFVRETPRLAWRLLKFASRRKEKHFTLFLTFWLNGVRQKRSIREKSAIAHRFRMGQMRARSFRSWSELVVHCRGREHRYRQVKDRAARQLLRTAFHSFIACTSKEMLIRVAIFRFELRRAEKQSAKAFRAWVQLIVREHVREQQIFTMLSRWTRHNFRLSIVKWYAVTFATKDLARYGKRLNLALARCRTRRFRTVLQSWRRAVLRKLQCQVLSSRQVQRWDIRKEHSSVIVWRAYVLCLTRKDVEGKLRSIESNSMLLDGKVKAVKQFLQTQLPNAENNATRDLMITRFLEDGNWNAEGAPDVSEATSAFSQEVASLQAQNSKLKEQLAQYVVAATNRALSQDDGSATMNGSSASPGGNTSANIRIREVLMENQSLRVQVQALTSKTQRNTSTISMLNDSLKDRDAALVARDEKIKSLTVKS